MRKIIMILAISLALFSCGNESQSDKRVKVKWVTDNNPARVVQEKLFEKMNPDIDLVVDPAINETIQNKVLRLSAGGVAPECFDTYSAGDLYVYISKGIIEDISDMFANGNKYGLSLDEFWPQLVTNWMIKNKKIWGIPNNAGCAVLFYNLDHFEEAGISPLPKNEAITWDKFIQISQILRKTNPKRAPLAFSTGNGFIFNALVHEWGGRVFSEDGKKCLLDSREANDALQFYIDLLYKYNISITPEEVQSQGRGSGYTGDYFASGVVSMIIDGRWKQIALRESPSIRYGVALIPSGPKSETSVLYGRVTVVSKNSKNINAAKRFISFLASKEFCNVINQSADGFSSVQKYAYDPSQIDNEKYPNEKEWVDVMLKQFETSELLEVSDYILYAEYEDIIKKYWDRFQYKTITTKEMLSGITKEVNDVISERL